MKAIRNLLHNRESKAVIGSVALLALALFAGTTVIAADKARDVDEQRDESAITTGSGERYQTTVNRRTEGALSAQDLHQVSLLTSRALNHPVQALQERGMDSNKRLKTDIVKGGHYAANLDAEADETYDEQIESLVHGMLVRLGEDPRREGLTRTPLRVAKAMDFLTSGYGVTAEEVVKGAVFEDDCKEMVLVKDIEFYSLCEHHVLPFFGRAHVAYLPNGKIIGLSKIARIVDVFARRLQVQERMTNQIADALMEIMNAHGVAVVTEASHFCMMMRGVQKQNSSTITSAMRGTFERNASTRAEFLDLIRR